MQTAFCLESLDDALARHEPPLIYNSDQGAQFTAQAHVNRLVAAGIAVSMDGRGRGADNVFVERLWRTGKHEFVFLRQFTTHRDLTTGLGEYFAEYNERRP